MNGHVLQERRFANVRSNLNVPNVVGQICGVVVVRCEPEKQLSDELEVGFAKVLDADEAPVSQRPHGLDETWMSCLKTTLVSKYKPRTHATAHEGKRTNYAKYTIETSRRGRSNPALHLLRSSRNDMGSPTTSHIRHSTREGTEGVAGKEREGEKGVDMCFRDNTKHVIFALHIHSFSYLALRFLPHPQDGVRSKGFRHGFAHVRRLVASSTSAKGEVLLFFFAFESRFDR